MPLLACKRGAKISVCQFARSFRTDHAGTQHQNVHVIVFDTLVGGIDVMTEARADARKFVRGDRSADPTAANQYSPIGLACAPSLQPDDAAQ